MAENTKFNPSRELAIKILKSASSWAQIDPKLKNIALKAQQWLEDSRNIVIYNKPSCELEGEMHISRKREIKVCDYYTFVINDSVSWSSETIVGNLSRVAQTIIHEVVHHVETLQGPFYGDAFLMECHTEALTFDLRLAASRANAEMRQFPVDASDDYWEQCSSLKSRKYNFLKKATFGYDIIQ